MPDINGQEVLYAFDSPRVKADNANGFNLGKEAIHTLDTYYPGWGWKAMVRQGVLMIRLPVSDKWGMNTRITEFDHDATAFKKRVIMAAGEFLERAGQKIAGKRDMIRAVEGIPRAQVRAS